MADRPEMFAPNRGFSGTADWMEPYQMSSGQPLLPWQRQFSKLGLLFTKIDSYFLFVDVIEPFLGRQFSMWHSTKRCSSIFDLGPLTPKKLLPKVGTCTKSTITRLVWQIDRICLRLIGGFRGWPIQWNQVTMLWGRPLLLWQRNLGKFRLFFDKIAHESSCMPATPDMFGPTSGDDQRGRSLLPRQRHLRCA